MANKAPRVHDSNMPEHWFTKRREKNRKRDKAAKRARKKNRGK